MPWSNNQFIGELTIPTGATTGARITINHNNDGAIKVYDSSNTLIAEISATADVIKALNAAGVFAKLDPSAPSGIADTPGPGLVLGGMSGDVEPGSLTEYDDTFVRGLYLRSSSPVADASALAGVDYGAIGVTGRFHGSDPQITILAGDPSDAPAGFVAINGTIFGPDGVMQSYASGNKTTFTPGVTGGGTVTWTDRTGYYIAFGPWKFVNIRLLVNANGSGAANVAVTLPFVIDGTIDQCLSGRFTEVRTGYAVHFAGTDSNTIDRIRMQDGGAADTVANVTGADLTTGRVINLWGWLLEAL